MTALATDLHSNDDFIPKWISPFAIRIPLWRGLTKSRIGPSWGCETA